MQHLLSSRDISTSELRSIISDAHTLLSTSRTIETVDDILDGRRIVLAFYESSTRTRLSFETAARRLGAETYLFQATGSSVEKGEDLRETTRTIQAMGFDAIILRHAQNGAHADIASFTTMHVINAGEGTKAHPTQALLDASALMERFGSLDGLRICIVGDIRHSRVARSNVDVFTRLGATVSLCAPNSLLSSDPEFHGCVVYPHIDEALANSDVVNLLRIQRERIEQAVVPGIEEYRQQFALTSARLAQHTNVTVIHPGPVNPGVETDYDVLTHTQSLIHRQVTHGVAVRMAVLRRVLQHV